jgi:hypothetical protein
MKNRNIEKKFISIDNTRVDRTRKYIHFEVYMTDMREAEHMAEEIDMIY